MSICWDKCRTKRIGIALLAWLVTAALVLFAAVLLIDQLKLNSKSIDYAAAAAIALASFAASLALRRGVKGGSRWKSALLLWLVTACTLLMLGFLADSDAMSLSGLIRILAGSLLGCLTALLFCGKEKKRTGKGKFMKTK